MGVLTKDAQGNLRDANTNQAQLLQDPAADYANDQQELAEMQSESLGQQDFTAGSTNGTTQAIALMEENLGKDHSDSIIIRALTSAVQDGGRVSDQAISELATGMGIEAEDALGVIENISTAYFQGAARYIDSAYEGVDGMEVIEWLGESPAPEGASRFVTSLVAGSTALVDQAVQAFLRRPR